MTLVCPLRHDPFFVSHLVQDGSPKPGTSRLDRILGESIDTSQQDIRHSDRYLFIDGNTPERTRTSDLRFRKAVLYPAELRGLM